MHPLNLLLLIVAVSFLVAFIQVGALTIAFEKLGLSAGSGITLLFVSLLGSLVNLPLFRMRAEAPPDLQQLLPRRLWPLPGQRPFSGHTVVAVNVGGGLVPLFFSLYLLRHNPLGAESAVAGIAIVTAVAYAFSRPVPGLGIGMPVLVAPLTAALVGLFIGGEQSAPLAYISGTLGVLVGADLLRLKDIRRLGAPIASIGGAGTFDGIFVTGIVAVLLA